MNSQELEQFCDKWLESWTGNNPEKLLSFYTNDAFYSDPAYPDGLEGKSDIRPYFIKLLGKNQDWKWEREILYPTHEGFSLVWKANIPIKDRIVAVKGMDRIVLIDEKISRNEVYFDTRVFQ